MSFAQTTVLKKGKYSVAISTVTLVENNNMLGYALDYYLNLGKSYEPIVITETVFNLDITTSRLFHCSSIDGITVKINESISGASVFVNISEIGQLEISDNVDNIILNPGELAFVSVYNNRLIGFKNVFPFGFCSEELSIKETQGNSINLSHGVSSTQSKNVEVVIPGFELFQSGEIVKVENNSVNINDAKEIYVAEVPAFDGSVIYVVTPSSNGVFNIEMTAQANQTNKYNLTIKNEVDFDNSSVLNIIENKYL